MPTSQEEARGTKDDKIKLKKMKTKSFFLFLIIILFVDFLSFSQEDIQHVKLPPPDTTGGMSLMQALKNRRTNRDFTGEKLSDQMLSNLLWAACGVNRPKEGKRTSPTAMNDQEIDVYVATAEGVFLYDAPNHQLIPVIKEDVRRKMGIQNFTKDASVMLVYVADYKKMSVLLSKEDKNFYAATDVGFVSQNVYLFCASENLATVVLGWINRDEIARILKLRTEQKVLLSQCVGFPVKK